MSYFPVVNFPFLSSSVPVLTHVQCTYENKHIYEELKGAYKVRNEMKRNQRKRNEINKNESKTKSTKTKRNRKWKTK